LRERSVSTATQLNGMQRKQYQGLTLLLFSFSQEDSIGCESLS
jgi:hypothetical protein